MFPAHGRDLDNAPFTRLAAKVRDCVFVVAISSYGRGQLYRWVEHQQWGKINLVHCGLEPAFYAVPANRTSSPYRFVCVGRLSPEKGQLLLIEAAERLFAQGRKFELVLVGDGESRGDIEALVSRYRLQGVIRMTGSLSGEQVRDEILAARALVLPSFTEGLPVVVMPSITRTLGSLNSRTRSTE